MSKNTKVITGAGTRWSYVHVVEPQSVNGGALKYSVCLLIPKEDTATLAALERATQAAYREGAAKLRGNGRDVPALDALKTPLRDGDVERPGDPAYAGCCFLNANSTRRPGVVDGALAPIEDPAEIYSGVYGRASITLYAYNTNGNRGIACWLNNLQKLQDGDPLDGRTRAEDDFAEASVPF